MTPMEHFRSIWNSNTRVIDILKALDKDESGFLEQREFQEAVRTLGLSAAAARELFLELDADGSGAIDFRELKKKMGHRPRNSGAGLLPQQVDAGSDAQQSQPTSARLPRVAARKKQMDAMGVLPAAANRERAISRTRAEYQLRRSELEREEARELAGREPAHRGDATSVQACLRPSPRMRTDLWRPPARSGGGPLEPLLDGRGVRSRIPTV